MKQGVEQDDSKTEMVTWGLILAAGQGQRFGAQGPKQFIELLRRPLVIWSLQAFQRATSIKGVILVLPEDQITVFQPTLAVYGLSKVKILCAGGPSRADSVLAGLAQLPEGAAGVAIHDSARPLVTARLIDRVVVAATKMGAALPVRPLTDTIKERHAGNAIRTLNRDALFAAQTPQVFRVDLIRQAYDQYRSEDQPITDDAQLVERLGHPVALVEGEETNVKITVPQDLILAAALLDQTRSNGEALPNRIGTGYDVHALREGLPLILGGEAIPHTSGLVGHSDADVLCHAIGDALLGAAGLGDLGVHFPDDDPRTVGVSSLKLLAQIRELVGEAGYRVGNLDSTVVCERPHLAPRIPAMRQNIARALQLEESQVSVKATTTEGLGFTGRGEGIAAHASVVLIPGGHTLMKCVEAG